MTLLVCEAGQQAALAAGLPGPLTWVGSATAVRRAVAEQELEDLVVLGPDVALAAACEVAVEQRVARPTLGVVLVRRRVDATVLGEALRAGVREVVRLDDLVALQEGCARSLGVSAQLRQATAAPGMPTGHRGRVVTVFSSKGGCGKTTVATNLAVSLALQGHRTCLVDLDLAGGDVCIALQLQAQRTVSDVFATAGPLDAAAVGALVTRHGSGLDVIAAPLDPADADRLPAGQVPTVLESLRGLYDVVVLDTPPTFTDVVLAAFDVSDVNLLLATMDVPALKNLRVTVETLRLLGCPPERCRIVLNRSDARVGLTLDDVQRALGVAVDVQIPSSRDVPLSINRGVPIVLELPKHPVSAAVRAWAQQLAGVPVTRAGAHRKRLGLRARRSVTA